MPIVSLNAKNDIVYLQRYSSETSEPLTNAPSLWLILKMQLQLQLQAESNYVFVLPTYTFTTPQGLKLWKIGVYDQ